MPPELLIAMVGIFVAVAIVTGTATSWWLTRATPEQRRLRTIAQPHVSALVFSGQALAETPDPMLARLARLVPKSPKDMSRLQRRLTRAGYPHFRATVYFSLAQLALPVVFACATIAIFGLRGGLLYAFFAAALGFVMPGLYIDRKTRLRQKAIRNGLPDALDLMTVCVEAGSALDQAIAKASVELRIAHPALADELRFITTEVRAGKPRLQAFQNFAQRTGVDDVRTLVSMLTQTDRFGTSIGQALRVQSEQSRTKRRQRAEERAGKVGVKLVFPLAFCLFPALYIVCFGPVAIRIYRIFLAGS